MLLCSDVDLFSVLGGGGGGWWSDYGANTFYVYLLTSSIASYTKILLTLGGEGSAK